VHLESIPLFIGKVPLGLSPGTPATPRGIPYRCFLPDLAGLGNPLPHWTWNLNTPPAHSQKTGEPRQGVQTRIWWISGSGNHQLPS